MSTRDLLVVGHGGFSEGCQPVDVPDRCEVRFYVAHGYNMNGGAVRGILSNALGFRFHWLCCRAAIPPKKQLQVPAGRSQVIDPDTPFADVELVTW